MVFTEPRVNLFVSDEGFSVEFLGRNGIEYKEGEKSMRVDTEMLVPPHGVSIYQESIKGWRRPFESVLLTAEHKNRIVDNISRVIESQGLRVRRL
jgi:hypothetical protein